MKFKIINYKVYYNKDEILDVFKDLVVGKNPAVLFLYLVIPLTVLVLLIASLYWGEYEYWNKYYKLQKKQIKTLEYKGEDNEKSELQG